MTLPLKIAIALLQMMKGDAISQSKIKSPIVDAMKAEKLIVLALQGTTKGTLRITDPDAVASYLRNQLNINNLEEYVKSLDNADLTRSGAIEVSSDSKLKSIRTFKGFLVNSYKPINATLNGKPFLVNPTEGTYTFISDYESFIPAPDVTIVGIENPENFRYINKQQKYFQNIKPIFVSRYPQEQSKDLIKWLGSIPNPYLHFGDFDFAGIGIYLNEYKKHLGDRASFFIPDHVEALLQKYGNSKLYDKQFAHQPYYEQMEEKSVHDLIRLFHLYKKVLEQEILLSQ